MRTLLIHWALNMDIATKYEVFNCFKMIVNFINRLALKTLILQLCMKCLPVLK